MSSDKTVQMIEHPGVAAFNAEVQRSEIYELKARLIETERRELEAEARCAKMQLELARARAEATIWQDRCEAERQAHEASCKHFDKMMNVDN
jgi:hypothetical protein